MIYTSDGEIYEDATAHALGVKSPVMVDYQDHQKDMVAEEGSLENDPYATTDMTGAAKLHKNTREENSKVMKNNIDFIRDVPRKAPGVIPGMPVMDPEGMSRSVVID